MRLETGVLYTKKGKPTDPDETPMEMLQLEAYLDQEVTWAYPGYIETTDSKDVTRLYRKH